ncbi:ATP-binding protein, partial [Streptomyces sp. S6]
MGPHPAVAAIRLAVRRVLHDILIENDHPETGNGHPAPPSPQPLVLVACSGGADSMALASALSFEAPRLGLRAGGVTVDHGLQSGSADRAREVVTRLRELGLDPLDSAPVTVGREGGPEAAARDARYA